MSIAIAIISSGALSAIVAGIFNVIFRHMDKKEKENEVTKKLDDIESRLKIAEKDAVRTQLLLLMADYPDEIAEILKLAEHYFWKLKADWYLTSLFNKWLEKKGIAKPEWFE